MAVEKARHSPDHQSDFFYGYVIVGVAFIMMFVIWGAFYAFGVFFKPILKEFGWTRAMTAGAFSLCSIIQGLLGIAMGGFTDRFGPRVVMTLCGLFLGAGYLLMSQVSVIWELYFFYGAIVGAGMGGSFTPLMSTIARWFKGKRGTMTGIVGAGTGIGALIGPPVVSRLVSGYGWRASYLIVGAVVLAGAVLCAQFIRRDPARIGQAAYGDQPKERQVEKQAARELSLSEAVSTMQFWIVFGMVFSLGFCVFAIMVHIVAHVVELGIPTLRAANILAMVGGASVVGKILMGKAVDKIGSRQVFRVGFFLMTAALLTLFAAKSEWVLYLFAAVFGFAFGGCISSESPMAAELFGLRSHGLILGVIALSFVLGGAVGPLLLGYTFDVTGSYQWGFLVCAAISLTGLTLTSILKRQ